MAKTLRSLVLGTIGTMVLATSDAPAQPFPARPITIIVSFAAGGAVDLNMRMIARQVEKTTGVTIVVENKVGAGGKIGATAGKLAAPNGYTLVQMDHGSMAAAPAFDSKLPYDPIKDFTPVTQLYFSEMVLFAAAGFPANSVSELATLAKSKPGGLSYASQGVASGGHLAGAALAQALSTDMTHVPYSGGALARQDILAGRVDIMFNNYASFRGDVEAGLMKALAVASPQQLPILPNVPTLIGSGYPEFNMRIWFGIGAPAGLPDEVLATLNNMFVSALKSPEVSARLIENGFTPAPMTPLEYRSFIASEVGRWGDIVRRLGLQGK
jgi:tripartite-type tricarboxylate transporter receptor subunit TctC